MAERATVARRAEALALVAAFVTLSFQILVHRMVSAKFVNNYAFLVISLTMLGFAASGAVLARGRERLLRRRPEAFTLAAGLFAASALAASSVLYRVPTEPGWAASRASLVGAFLQCMPYALLFSVPFAFCGGILGLLLSDPSLPAHRIYFSDLLGSAAGALAVVSAIGWLGVETSVVLLCLALVLSALLLWPPRVLLVRTAGIAAGVLLALFPLWREPVFRFRFPAGSPLAATQDAGSGTVLEHMAWDSLARIEWSRIPPPDPTGYIWPSLLGGNRAFLGHIHWMLTQNNNAFTFAPDYDGRRESLLGIEETIYAAAYEATSVPSPRVAVIGVGGGFDVLAALRFDASDITGVEVNAATVGILTRKYRDHFRHWLEDPRVHLIQGEGRQFFATHSQPFDVIQLSGVDSASGTPAAAHVFAESYLYTAEAFDTYLAHLNPDGIMNMMRLEYVPPREMLRALSTAVAALRRMGVRRPSDHIVTITDVRGTFTALLVKRGPFADAELNRLQAWASGERFFRVTAGPPWNGSRANPYQTFLAPGDPRWEAAFITSYPFDISPVDDNRPFFFKYSSWSDLLPRRGGDAENLPIMELGLLLLLAMTLTAGAALVLLPLRGLGGRGKRPPRLGRPAVFFAGIGLGYMGIEIAFLQKFALLLGHPNYALSVVLAGLLLATGLGSLGSPALLRAFGNLRYLAYGLAVLVLAEYALAFPLLPHAITLPFPLRVGLVFALVAPVGLGLGTFFPVGLERLKTGSPDAAAWAWGLNGLASVVGPILAVGVSMTWGTNALLLAALPIYMIAGLAAPEALADFPPPPPSPAEPAAATTHPPPPGPGTPNDER